MNEYTTESQKYISNALHYAVMTELKDEKPLSVFCVWADGSQSELQPPKEQLYDFFGIHFYSMKLVAEVWEPSQTIYAFINPVICQ